MYRPDCQVWSKAQDLRSCHSCSRVRIPFRTLFFTNSKNDIFKHYRAYTIDLINSVTSSKINNFENFLDKSIYFFETGVFSNTFEIYHLFISYHTANFQALQHLLIGNTFAEFVKNLFFEFLRDFFMKEIVYFQNCSELLLFRTHFLKIFNVGSADSIFIKQMISNKIDLKLGSFSGNGLGLFGDYSGGINSQVPVQNFEVGSGGGSVNGFSNLNVQDSNFNLSGGPVITLNNARVVDVNRKLEPEDIDLKTTYYTNESMYLVWLEKQVMSRGHRVFISNKVKHIFNYDVKTIEDVKRLILNGELGDRGNLAFRNFIKYLEENSIFKISIIQTFKAYIKGTTKNHVDDFVPETPRVLETMQLVYDNCDYEDYIIFRAVCESGARWTEVVKMVKEFDESKVEYHDNLALYDFNYKRGEKNIYYLYLHASTMKFISENLTVLRKKLIQKYSWCRGNSVRLKTGKDLLHMKYFRKYLRTKLAEFEANNENAEFIAGRSSSGVGWTHYREKKLSTLREFGKVYDFYCGEIFDVVEVKK